MSIVEIEKKYKARTLNKDTEVVRVAPSPTGFVHIGLLYMATICEYIARQSKGVFILRVEDTDRDREKTGAREEIVRQLANFGIVYDEGLYLDDSGNLKEKGGYGPYLQSERSDIYNSYANLLLEKGLAYKCYMSSEEIDILRKAQMENKIRPGVYGLYAKYRDADNVEIVGKERYDEYQELLKSDKPYVLRFKSHGDMNKKFRMEDVIMGSVDVPENDEDFVIIKTDKHSSYHFAHVIDDRLMGTTLVIRGNEWFASLGKHIELWKAFGWDIPKYAHVAPINKQEGGTVRKLSKRKDNEADVKFFLDSGYKKEAIIAYLLRLANPSFDDYFSEAVKQNLNLVDSINDYHFRIDELARGGRGPLLDIPKLNNISCEIVAKLSAEELYEEYVEWLSKYDLDFYKVVTEDRDYSIKVLGVERTGEKIRKDIINYSVVKNQIYYMFDECFFEHKDNSDRGNVFSQEKAKKLLDIMLDNKVFDLNQRGDSLLSLDDWLLVMKEISKELEYEKFGDFMKDLRISITGEERTPNLYHLLSILGFSKVEARLLN